MNPHILLFDEHGVIRPFEKIEKDIIQLALQHCGGRMTEVAKKLGIGRSTLYRKTADYGINPKRLQHQ